MEKQNYMDNISDLSAEQIAEGIANGIVTGTNTAFSEDFEIGDKFLAATSGGKVVEFTVRSIDNATNPLTVMRVTPSDISVPAGALYQKNQILGLQNKINEIISAMKSLNLLV
jgi:hypothetical protein